MTPYTIRQGQTIYDVCLNTYQSLNYLFKLLVDNSITISSILTPGKTLLFDKSFINNNSLFNATTNNNIFYTTETDEGEVFGTEDFQQIFISEDEATEFIPEN